MGCSERDKSQVTLAPGLTLAGLISKLSKPVQPSRKITCVNVHVGINDCRNARIIKTETGAMPYTHYVVVSRQQESSSSILPLSDSIGHIAYYINKSNDDSMGQRWGLQW